MPALHDLTGQSFGKWTVIKRAPNRRSPSGSQRTYWQCRCSCGASGEVLAWELTSGKALSCGCYRAQNSGAMSRARRSDDIQYYPAHRRLERDRGFAKHHHCADCGSPAAEWSYNHDDPEERFDEKGRPYSPRAECYSPRCRSCHRRFDFKKGASADA